MPKIPIVSGKKLVKAFEKYGYTMVRQKGSHIRLVNKSNLVLPPLTIPNHKEVSIGVTRRLIRDSGISIDQLTKFLK